MDDNSSLDQAFGGTAPKTPVEEAWHNEQRRKQYDIIRVHNPTSQDFFVMYDVNQYQKIPANSTIDVPRYIAIRYLTHMKDHIINQQAQTKHDEHLKMRREKGFPDFKSKYEENEETYNAGDYPKTNDPKLMADVMDGLWIGLVHEFGRDLPPEHLNPRTGEVDLTPPETKIIDNLDKRRAPAQPIAAAPITTSFRQMNQRLSPEEVTSNE